MKPSPGRGGAQDRVKRIIASYPDPRSAVMPLLFVTSLEHGGHVTDDVQRQVAVLTGLTAAQVQAVASFYTMYKRDHVGRYVISVCTSISCFLVGADELLAAIEQETGTFDGETSEDATVSVEHVECIGACGGAPALQVNYELAEGVTPAKGRELCQWLRDAQPATVLGDELQQLFGGRRSFDWGPPEDEGAVLPVPALGRLGSTGGGS